MRLGLSDPCVWMPGASFTTPSECHPLLPFSLSWQLRSSLEQLSVGKTSRPRPLSSSRYICRVSGLISLSVLSYLIRKPFSPSCRITLLARWWWTSECHYLFPLEKVNPQDFGAVAPQPFQRMDRWKWLCGKRPGQEGGWQPFWESGFVAGHTSLPNTYTFMASSELIYSQWLQCCSAWTSVQSTHFSYSHGASLFPLTRQDHSTYFLIVLRGSGFPLSGAWRLLYILVGGVRNGATSDCSLQFYYPTCTEANLGTRLKAEGTGDRLYLPPMRPLLGGMKWGQNWACRWYTVPPHSKWCFASIFPWNEAKLYLHFRACIHLTLC